MSTGLPFKARISIHAPREGGDAVAHQHGAEAEDFNPRPPRGGRPRDGSTATGNMNFNPRPPRGGRLPRWAGSTRASAFQSTPPARGATRSGTGCPSFQSISIHAPREGGDVIPYSKATVAKNFNPRPPRGGRPRILRKPIPMSYFNPRPPRGGRLYSANRVMPIMAFQSTPPARGATERQPQPFSKLQISIHAPREGGDLFHFFPLTAQSDFNPRPPRGGRQP